VRSGEFESSEGSPLNNRTEQSQFAVARAFPEFSAAVAEGIDRRLHTGIQLCVMQNGVVQIDRGFGTADGDRPLPAAAIMPWRSAGKPLTALLILRCVEQGLFQLESRLRDVLPEAADTNKADIPLLKILTHTAGLAGIETGWPDLSWEDSVRRILRADTVHQLDSAAYDPHAGWFLLGEIARRHLDEGETFASMLRKHLLQPLGMSSTYCGLPECESDRADLDLPVLFDRTAGRLVQSEYHSGNWLTQESAGGGLRGPMSDLARFYEFLRLGGVAASGQRLISESFIREMVRPHRHNQYDATMQHRVDFGLGVVVDADHDLPETVPYGFGAGSSGACYGHGGAQCAMGFCDPQHGLIVCWSANGFCGEGHHLRRNHALNIAVYRDLGLLPEVSQSQPS